MNSPSTISRMVGPIDMARPVLVFNPSLKKGVTSKLAEFWKGPFYVLEQLSPHLFGSVWEEGMAPLA